MTRSLFRLLILSVALGLAAYADAHITAANVYIKSGNAEGALKEFEVYLHLAPNGKFAQKAQDNVVKLKELLKK